MALAIVLLSLAGWVAIVYGLVPVEADGAPSKLERWAARTALIAGVMRREHHGKNPLSGPAAIVDGIHIYRANCEVCHGNASGAATPVAQGLYQRPPQFAKDGAEDLPYAYSSWVIAHGIRLTGMPAFARNLSTTQIADVTLFLQQMNHLTPDEAFAWRGVPLRSSLVSLYRAIGGNRACQFFPTPGVKPHTFREEAGVTHDGTFIVERYFNRGISELVAIGGDRSGHRFVRTKVSKSGDADVAVSQGPVNGDWAWTTTPDGGEPTTTVIKPQRDGSYTFATTNGGGYGKCSARQPL